MASASSSNDEMAVISDSWKGRIPWRPGFSQSGTAFLFIVRRGSFEDMGICQYLESVIKILDLMDILKEGYVQNMLWVC